MKAIKIPCEHDLLSKNDEIWANAVMRCKVEALTVAQTVIAMQAALALLTKSLQESKQS
ncbi:hypothetical protein [Acinetobacter phage Ab65]|nr:hypothetical protein [Acinetobacter phage Ab65]